MELILTKNASLTLQEIFFTIELKFGSIAAEKFLLEVEKTLKLATLFPEMFKKSNSSNTRMGQVSKLTNFIYEINATSITVLYFWDNRQEPFE